MYNRSLIEKIFLKYYYIYTSLYFKLIHNINIGKNCRIELSATIRGNVNIGDDVSIGKFVNITGNVDIGNLSNIHDFARINTMPSGKIDIGKNCHINVYNVIGSSKKVTIKDYALFAAGVKITDSTHGIENVAELTKDAMPLSEELLIEENCWLGFDVNVIMRAQIGKNCVIGSKSLVNKIIPHNSVAVGIPAKVIRKR